MFESHHSDHFKGKHMMAYLKKLFECVGSEGDLSKHRQHTTLYEDLCM